MSYIFNYFVYCCKKSQNKMPLQNVDTPYYVKRTRVFVDSAEKIPTESRTNFFYTVPIRGDIKDVISIELVDWNLSSLYAPTFIGKYQSLLPGNYYNTNLASANIAQHVNNRQTYPSQSKFDIRIQNETLTHEIILTVDMDEFWLPQSLAGVQYETRTAMLNAIDAAIQFHFDELGTADPIINTTNTSFTVQLDDSDHFQIYFYRTVGNNAMPCYFLFETGPSITDGAPKQLGFIPNVDTTLPPLSPSGAVGNQYILTATNKLNLTPFRYIDIFVREIDETNEPVARVFFQTKGSNTPEYIQPFDKGLRSRLLTNSIDRLNKMTIKLELEGGREPSFYGEGTHQLTFDILTIVPKQENTKWIKQRFDY